MLCSFHLLSCPGASSPLVTCFPPYVEIVASYTLSSFIFFTWSIIPVLPTLPQPNELPMPCLRDTGPLHTTINCPGS